MFRTTRFKAIVLISIIFVSIIFLKRNFYQKSPSNDITIVSTISNGNFVKSSSNGLNKYRHKTTIGSLLKPDNEYIVDYDPLKDGVFDETTEFTRSPRDLYRKVRAEARDKLWAPNAERVLRERIRDVPYVDESFPATIRCGTTICEIVGKISSEASFENGNIAIKKLQSPDLGQGGYGPSFNKNGMSVTFGTSKSYPGGDVFVRYIYRL